MLTGRAPFAGDTLTDILAAVVKTEPDWSRLPAVTPSSLRRVLRRCLQKDAAQRYQSIAEVRLDIEDVDVRLGGPAPLAAGRPRLVLSVLLGAALAAVSVAGVGLLFRGRAPRQATPLTTRVELTLPKGVELYHTWHGVALAGNGRSIAFVGVAGGVRQVYTRRLDEFTTVAIKVRNRSPRSCFRRAGTRLRSVGRIVR